MHLVENPSIELSLGHSNILETQIGSVTHQTQKGTNQQFWIN